MDRNGFGCGKRNDRQLEVERAARAGFAVHADGAAVEFNKSPADGQSQSRSFRSFDLRPRAFDLLKFVKDTVLILRRNPDPVILHGDAHVLAGVHGFEMDLDATSFRREFHRVCNEVVEHLPDSFFIAPPRPRPASVPSSIPHRADTSA